MAAVADRLGVTPMALYQHVQDKDHLLGLLMNSLLERVEVPPRSAGQWEQRLRQFHLDVTAAMTRYPGMVETPKTPPSEIPRLLNGYLQILLDAGFDPATAGRAYTGLYYLAMGVSHPRTVRGSPAAIAPNDPALGATATVAAATRDVHDSEWHAYALDVYIEGLQHRLVTRPKRRSPRP
jgi:AcrR family transcriptional regulator